MILLNNINLCFFFYLFNLRKICVFVCRIFVAFFILQYFACYYSEEIRWTNNDVDDKCVLEINENWSVGEQITIPNSSRRRNIRIKSRFPDEILKEYPINDTYTMQLNCPIEKISIEDFENASNLTYLRITSTELKRIPERVFSDLKNLRELELQDCTITVLDDYAFTGMNEVFTIKLQNNQITTLKANLFLGLNKLLTLHFDHNYISIIEEGTFNLPKIFSIHAAHNNLAILPKQLFANAPNLETLILSHNKFIEFPEALFESTVKELDLSYNQIVNFELTDLSKLTNLSRIDLSNNKINLTEIYYVKQNYTSNSLITDINLSSNNITSSDILKHLSIFRYLEHINLRHNEIKCLNDFENIRKMFPILRRISLTGQEMCEWLRSLRETGGLDIHIVCH